MVKDIHGPKRLRVHRVTVVLAASLLGLGAVELGAPEVAQAQGINTTSVTDIANPDGYTCSQPGFVGFESLPDGTTLPGTIAGLDFVTAGGETWRVGDFSTGNYNGKYPNGAYMSEGTHWAWLGPNQGSGRIDMSNGAASYFSLLTSVGGTDVYLEAYDASGTLLATAGPASYNINTGHMTELKITRASPDIAYVIVHDTGNFFIVDSICTDAPGVHEGIILDLNVSNGLPNIVTELDGTIIDASPGVSQNDYSATVYWGDGASDTAVYPNGTVPGQPPCPSQDTCTRIAGFHNYSSPGSYIVKVVLDRTLGGKTTEVSGTTVVNIVPSNAPPTIKSVGLLTFDKVGTTNPQTGQPYVSGCTASVVDSPSGDLILTAKHCLDKAFGAVDNFEFAPFHQANHPCWNNINASQPYQIQVAQCGGNPLGVWYAKATTDITFPVLPRDNGDYAFISVHPAPGEGSVEAVAGGIPIIFDMNGSPDPELSQGWHFYLYPPDDIAFAQQHQFRLLACSGNPAGNNPGYFQLSSTCGFPPKLCPNATQPCPYGGSGGPWVNSSNGIYEANLSLPPFITGIGAVLQASVPDSQCGNGCYGSLGTILGYGAMKTYEKAALSP